MNILVLNAGSSSIKYKLLDMQSHTLLAAGSVERIGEDGASLAQTVSPGGADEREVIWSGSIPDHERGVDLLIAMLTDPEKGAITDRSDIDAVGHRVVHGGENFTAPALIDDAVVQAIEETIPLAPLHNPGNLTGIRAALRLFPDAPQVAVFDTAFHQTMPPQAYHYALPYELYEDLRIRRYGFHGTSHQYVSREAAALLEKPLDETSLITLHVGNGASAAAVKNGKSINTSMGMTPLGGLVMGTRSGDIDPAILGYLKEHKGWELEEIEHILTHESGLKGLCGANDLRDIHRRKAQGDKRAQLALDVYIHRVRQYIGAYYLELSTPDALVFTAGVGENDAVFRELCCQDLEPLGIEMDLDKNRNWDKKAHAALHKDGSRVKIFVIRTNEELEIARCAMELINRPQN